MCGRRPESQPRCPTWRLGADTSAAARLGLQDPGAMKVSGGHSHRGLCRVQDGITSLQLCSRQAPLVLVAEGHQEAGVGLGSHPGSGCRDRATEKEAEQTGCTGLGDQLLSPSTWEMNPYAPRL